MGDGQTSCAARLSGSGRQIRSRPSQVFVQQIRYVRSAPQHSLKWQTFRPANIEPKT